MAHSTGFLNLVQEAKKNIKETDIDTVRKKQQEGNSFYLVDTREDREWNAGYIEGAIHLGKGVIERDIESAIPDKEAEIILYCGGGFRSAIAAEALQKMGYSNVQSMDGGWRAWKEAAYPVAG